MFAAMLVDPRAKFNMASGGGLMKFASRLLPAALFPLPHPSQGASWVNDYRRTVSRRVPHAASSQLVPSFLPLTRSRERHSRASTYGYADELARSQAREYYIHAILEFVELQCT